VYHTPPSAAGATSCGCEPAGTGNVATEKDGVLEPVAVGVPGATLAVAVEEVDVGLGTNEPEGDSV
jgi:hypothetical protein